MTLLEMLVVLSIIGSLCAAAAGMFPSAIQYFRARRSMETVMWNLRKVQQRARSRGHVANVLNGFGPAAGMGAADPATYGLKVFAGTVIFDGAALVKDPNGFSYLPYGPERIEPADDLAALTANQRAQVVNLDASLVPVADGSIPSGARLLPAKIVFSRDVSSGLGDIIPEAGSAAGCAGCPGFLDFRTQNADGYFRIQFENQRFIGMRYVPL